MLAVCLAGSLLVGCSGANPAQAEADLATGGLSAGNDAQVTAALAATSTIVKAWQLENMALPTPAQFATIPGAAASGGATVTYKATASGLLPDRDVVRKADGGAHVGRAWRAPAGRHHLLIVDPLTAAREDLTH